MASVREIIQNLEKVDSQIREALVVFQPPAVPTSLERDRLLTARMKVQEAINELLLVR